MRSLTDEAEATVGEDVGKYPHHKEYSDYHAQHFEVPRGGQVTVHGSAVTWAFEANIR